MPGASRLPTERDAAQAVRAGLGVEAADIRRFPTGLCHYVYDVITNDGQRVVARLATTETRDLLAGGVYWHARLRGVGAPLAGLLAADLTPANGFPFMLLERLPGQDLGLVYDELTREQRYALVADVVAIQRAVASLPHAAGYGFARSYDDPDLRVSWLDVVLAEVERSRQRIASASVVSLGRVERVRACVIGIEAYLLAVAPIAFLDDTTTKNVLVQEGALTGIVDTDVVCFGDPLFTLALTRVALLAHGHDTDYAEHWADLLRLTGEQRRALSVYVAVFCLGFMSELGQRFNRAEPLAADHAYQSRLERLLDGALAAS